MDPIATSTGENGVNEELAENTAEFNGNASETYRWEADDTSMYPWQADFVWTCITYHATEAVDCSTGITIDSGATSNVCGMKWLSGIAQNGPIRKQSQVRRLIVLATASNIRAVGKSSYIFKFRYVKVMLQGAQYWKWIL